MGIDHIKELVDFSRDNIRKDHPELLESGQVELIGKYNAFVLLCFASDQVILMFE